jgi:hypothetical protein
MSDSDEIRHGSDRKRSDLQVGSLALGIADLKQGLQQFEQLFDKRIQLVYEKNLFGTTDRNHAIVSEIETINEEAADLCTDIDDASELLSELESEFGNTNIFFK